MTELSNQLGNTMNKAKRPRRIGLLKALYVGMFASMSLLSACEKYELDRQMEALCKKDGGVCVYETVELPKSQFNDLGSPFSKEYSQAKRQEDRLGSDYRFVTNVEILKDGDALKGQGELMRFHEQIFRRSDGKLLGESMLFGRSGGDFIAFAHPTSDSCPRQQNTMTLIKSVFVHSKEK